MTKTSFEIEKKFLDNLIVKHGRSLDNWMKILRNCSLSVRSDLVSHLKSEYGFQHIDASLLAGVIMNGGQPVYVNEVGLLADQFINKEHLKTLYQSLIEFILTHIPSTNVMVKKSYISLSAKREYAAIKIISNEIRLVIDLEDEPSFPFKEREGIGYSSRMAHTLKLIDSSQLKMDLVKYLRIAYERNS